MKKPSDLPADQGVVLDKSNWPVVHGSRESRDNTQLLTPRDNHLRFWNSEGSLSSMLSPDEDGKDFHQDFFHEVMDFLLYGAEGKAKGGFSMEDANAVSVITEYVSDSEQRLWTSTLKNVVVFGYKAGASELEPLASFDHGTWDFRYHGTYAFTCSSGNEKSFLVAMKEDLYRYTFDEGGPQGNGAPSLRQAGHLWLGARDNSSKDGDKVGDESDEGTALVGLTLTNDGTIISATKGGILTAIRMGPGGQLIPISTLDLRKHVEFPKIHISNSISVHDTGIFIVTQQEMVRVDFYPEEAYLVFNWSTAYDKERPWYTSRLGPGSGSTPTLTRCLDRDMVVITDGDLDMHLIYLDAATGEEVARTTVDFGPSVGQSTSEQSVAVKGCSSFVVNNFIGVDGINDDVYCNYAQGPGQRRALGKLCSQMDVEFIEKVCPAVFGCVAYGAAMYELVQPEASVSAPEIARRWARDDVTCGTSIPLISDNNEASITYCIGMKRGESLWGLLGLDTDTGVEVLNFTFYQERLPSLGNFWSNPYYAGVEAVGPRALAIGSIGGVTFLTATAESTTANTTSLPLHQGEGGEWGSEPSHLGPRGGGLVDFMASLLLLGLVAVAYIMASSRRGGYQGETDVDEENDLTSNLLHGRMDLSE